MTFAVYENITMNAAYVGAEAGRQSGSIQSQRVFLVIDGVPEGTSPNEIAQKDGMWNLCAVELRRQNAEIAPESEWPEEVRRQVRSRQFDPGMRRSSIELN